MTYGSRGAAHVVKNWSARDYVQDRNGVMLDAENNGGLGVHLANLQGTWTNLFTGANAPLMGNMVPWTWGDNYLQTSSANGWFYVPVGVNRRYVLSDAGVANLESITVEMVFESLSTGSIFQYCPVEAEYRTNATCSNTGKWALSITMPNNSAVYINGVLSTNYQNLTVNLSAPIADEECLAFGGFYNGCPGGRLYRATAYSRALTAAEITHNYNIDRLRFNLP